MLDEDLVGGVKVPDFGAETLFVLPLDSPSVSVARASLSVAVSPSVAVGVVDKYLPRRRESLPGLDGRDWELSAVLGSGVDGVDV
jgi:hypothetical protein